MFQSKKVLPVPWLCIDYTLSSLEFEIESNIEKNLHNLIVVF